jgi:hypothetical protein
MDGMRPRPKYRLRRRFPAASALWLLLFSAGCSLPSSPTMATVPREWRQVNPWGPEANAARAEGKLVPLFYTEEMAEWAKFGRCHIQDGDILFRYGRSYSLYDNASSRIIAGAEDNRFSHDGVAHWENDTLYIYDVEPAPQGVRKIPFEFWVLDVANKSLTIKRLRPEYQACIPAALHYCEDAYERQIPFDDALRLDDEKLYCSEMIEKAYRSAGVVLSEPIRIECLPNYRRWRILKPVIQTVTPVRATNAIFALGNPYYGTFGSPLLETVYEQSPDPWLAWRKPPICSADVYPAPPQSATAAP